MRLIDGNGVLYDDTGGPESEEMTLEESILPRFGGLEYPTINRSIPTAEFSWLRMSFNGREYLHSLKCCFHMASSVSISFLSFQILCVGSCNKKQTKPNSNQLLRKHARVTHNLFILFISCMFSQQ